MEKYGKLVETGKLQLVGSILLVELMEQKELKSSKESNLVLPKANAMQGDAIDPHRVKYGKVLATGPGYYDPEQPTNTKVGNIIVIISGTPIIYLADLCSEYYTNNMLGLIDDSTIKLKFPDYQSFVDSFEEA